MSEITKQEAKPAEVTPTQMINRVFELQHEAIGLSLPKNVDPDRFRRIVITAVKAVPELVLAFGTEAGQQSVLIAVMNAAAVGLEVNTPTQEAWLLPRKRKGQHEAQLMIGYRGYLKLARRSGTIQSIRAEVVRDNDEFDYGFGLEGDRLNHSPGDGTGNLTHAYAIARFKDGGHTFRVLTKAEVEQRKAVSDSAKSDFSPWNKWPAEMWRKTAIRALVPFLELSPDDARVAASDERPLLVDQETGEILPELSE